MPNQYVRVFQSAIDPADTETLQTLFAEDLQPAFAGLAGCTSVELLLSCEHNAGGLIEGAALSRWESREAMDEAMASRPVREALVRITELLRQEPVTRVFEVVG